MSLQSNPEKSFVLLVEKYLDRIFRYLRNLTRNEEMARLIEGDQFWDEAILSFLDQRAPADLRAKILGETDNSGENNNSSSQGKTTRLTWQTKTKFILWQATRGYSHKLWLNSIIVLIEVFALIYIVRWLIDQI